MISIIGPMASNQPSSSNYINLNLYLNFSMAGWANGSVTNPHQVGEAGSIPAPAKMILSFVEVGK